MSALQLVTRKNIDEHKWDTCISNSQNSLPYAYTWYLDAVSENWDALVMNDYEAVMPLIWLRKLTIKGLYQPYYCQQLGVFFQNTISESLLVSFLEYAKTQYVFIDINLNSSAADFEKEFGLKRKKNLLLNLNKDYTLLKKTYSQNHKRNIAKSLKNNLQVNRNVTLAEFQKFYLQNIDRVKENFKARHEQIFQNLTKEIIKQKVGIILAAQNENGEILSVVLILKHKNRIINLINASSEMGKQLAAMHFLMDNIIQEYASTECFLDFEGSSVPSIARFYSGFGAFEESFFLMQSNFKSRLRQLFY